MSEPSNIPETAINFIKVLFDKCAAANLSDTQTAELCRQIATNAILNDPELAHRYKRSSAKPLPEGATAADVAQALLGPNPDLLYLAQGIQDIKEATMQASPQTSVANIHDDSIKRLLMQLVQRGKKYSYSGHI